MMCKRLAALVALMALTATGASAQITVPNTFTTRQVISSSKMNQNFDEVELKALNRVTPILQGTVTVDVTNTYDLGASGGKFRDLWLGRNASIGGTLTVSGTGTHVVGGGGTSSNSILKLNGASGTGNGGFIQLARNGTTFANIGNRAAIIGSGTSSDLVLFAETGNAMGFMVNGSATQSFGINTAGDWLFLTNLMDSTGTPSCGSGCSSIAGRDYAFRVVPSSTSTPVPAVNFGHTFNNTPICTATAENTGGTAVYPIYISAISTTAISFAAGSSPAGVAAIHVHCRGY